MATLAQILYDLGNRVSGYDDYKGYKFTQEGIDKRGIEIFYDSNHDLDMDTIVTYSKAFSDTHPEIKREFIRKIDKAVQDGYENYIVKGRCPLCVLNISMDPHLLDVNVHPSKWEVRLSKENQLEYLIRDQVEEVLKSSAEARKVRTPSSAAMYSRIRLDTESSLEMPFAKE